jgi:hypothetical protein
VSTFARRAADRLCDGVERLLLAGLALGRTERVTVFFFELRARVAAVFLFEAFLADFFEVDFFRVTFFATSLRLDDDLPALDTFFLPALFLLDFLSDAGFFGEVRFAEAGFFLLVFFEDAAAERLRERFFADLFDTFFVAAAFRFGMRFSPQVAPNEAGDYT